MSSDEISADWIAWLTENRLRGGSPNELVEALVGQGVSADKAKAVLDELHASPIFRGAQTATQELRVFELQRRLKRTLAGACPRTIEAIDPPSGEDFFRHYYATNTPVVLRDFVSHWPAMNWTFAGLRERCGHADIQVCGKMVKRTCDEISGTRGTTKSSFGEYIEWIERVQNSNDRYMVSANYVMDHPDVLTLRNDIVQPSDYFDRDKVARNVRLWMGAGGTITPMHHDSSNNVMCQIKGRKRFRMIAPSEQWLYRGAVKTFSAFDLDQPDYERFPEAEGVIVYDCIVEPGQAIFLPVGWWHHVFAFEPTINISCTNFIHNNGYGWYRPGEIE